MHLLVGIPLLVAAQGGADMMPFLNTVANFTAQLSLPSNHLQYPNGSSMSHNAGGTDHIFVNGNLARVLLSTWRLQKEKNQEFLLQALSWCDTLCSLQQPIVSSRGNQAGYWGVGYPLPSNCSADEPLRGYCAHSGSIYFGDTGTAATTLALCYKLSKNSAQKTRFMETMERFATFVLEGSDTVPVDKKGRVDSFVNPNGAIGCGYYHCTNRTSDNCAAIPGPDNMACPSRSPYVIATGTTGAAFFAELFGLTGNKTYATVAKNSVDFAASLVLTNGEIPYVLDGANCSIAGCIDIKTGTNITGVVPRGGWPYDTISYVTEGVVALALNMPSEQPNLVKQWKPTVDFLLATQNADGYWGEGRPSDLMRSPRVLTLLSWWLTAVETPTYKDKPTELAVARYLDFLRIEGIGLGYGVCHNTITTGMAGIAVADSIQLGVSY